MNRHLIDLDALEGELNGLADIPEARPIDYAQPRHRHETPDYVEHDERVSDIGAVTAAAVVLMHEQAAKSIEAMGEEGTRLVNRCEEVIKLTHETMEQIKRLAERVREHGAKAFAEIEGYAILTEEMKQTSVAIAQKIGVEINASSS